ncbi:MAG: VWA domain-containing protein [Desulfocapsa sp.]|nr:VWA domain-containing protein [Desulfocapsa sp.]
MMNLKGKKIGFLTLCFLALGTQLSYTATVVEEEEKEKIDDWEYVVEETEYDSAMANAVRKKAASVPMPNMQVAAEATMRSPSPLGFAVGGAKDADNFFQNLEEGYLPRYSSLSYEGLFYDYTFDTGQDQFCDSLFCPSYARGISSDIFSGQTDYYLSLGLNSGLTEASFQRKQLNIVVVLDISGSMSSPFNSYYYDTLGQRKERYEGEPQSKMKIANQAIVAMLDHLHGSDRFGMVLFDDQGYRAKPLRLVDETDMEAIERHILALQPRGGTNMSSGLQKGIAQFAELGARLKDPTLYENRIIFLTDAMPNQGDLSKGGLFSMVQAAATKDIYTSFIGVGVDFNPDLIESITKTRGANYYAVHSSEDFKKRLDDEFDFMVTPLVFDLELQLSSDDYEIVGVFGTPEADLASGRMLKINTLFPSSTEEEEVRGGVVLVKLKKRNESNRPLHLNLSYSDRSGKHFSTQDTVSFAPKKSHWDTTGIRKAVLLTEYVSLLKNWLMDTRKGCNDKVFPPIPFPYSKQGLINPDFRPERPQIETWEQRSCPLEVSEGYQKLFTLFSRHFGSEMAALSDETLQKEMDVLDRLKGKKSGKRVDDWKVE